jgi:hypothetical protein
MLIKGEVHVAVDAHIFELTANLNIISTLRLLSTVLKHLLRVVP